MQEPHPTPQDEAKTAPQDQDAQQAISPCPRRSRPHHWRPRSPHDTGPQRPSSHTTPHADLLQHQLARPNASIPSPPHEQDSRPSRPAQIATIKPRHPLEAHNGRPSKPRTQQASSPPQHRKPGTRPQSLPAHVAMPAQGRSVMDPTARHADLPRTRTQRAKPGDQHQRDPPQDSTHKHTMARRARIEGSLRTEGRDKAAHVQISLAAYMPISSKLRVPDAISRPRTHTGRPGDAQSIEPSTPQPPKIEADKPPMVRRPVPQ